MVRYRVHCVIFFWPDAPSFDHFSSLGITTVNSCMMIELVIYGMMPSAKMANWVSAPPENRFKNPSTPLLSADDFSCFTASKSIPGTGICVPSRNRPITARVNKILFRSSGTLNMFLKLESTRASFRRRPIYEVPS